MTLLWKATTSNMGLSEVRESEFLNSCQSHGALNLKDPLLWELPQDMLVVNAIIVIKLYDARMKQDYDKSL